MTDTISRTIEWRNPTINFDPNKLREKLYCGMNHLLQFISFNPEILLRIATNNRVHLTEEIKEKLGIGKNLAWITILDNDGNLTAFGFANDDYKLGPNLAMNTIIINREKKAISFAGVRDKTVVACEYQPDNNGQYQLVHGMVSTPTDGIGMETPKSLEQATWPYYAGLITKKMLLINPGKLISTRLKELNYFCDQSMDGFRSHTHGNLVFIANGGNFDFPLPRRI